MARENEGQTLRDYGNRKKRYRKIRNFIILIIFFAIIIAGIIYWFRISNMTYDSYEVSNTISNTGEYEAGYINYGGSVVKFNKDGASAIDRNGDVLWNGSYEMLDPIADTCGDYVAVADRGGKSIHIYNRKGEVGNITTLYNIIKIEVASQGVVAALMEDGENSYIKLYYTDGTVNTTSEDSNVLSEIVKSVNEVGYPMDFSLSEDGKKLFVSFLSITSGELVTNIGFYNFGEVGKNYTDNFMGGYKYEGIIVPRVTFLGNNVACAFKENGFALYTMPEKPDLIYQENFERKIKSVLHNGKYAGLVLEAEEGVPAQLLLYDLKGNKVLEKDLNFEYNKIFLSGDEIIMYDNLNCIVLKTNGKEKFRYTFSSNVSAFYPINHIDKYFLINAEEIAEINLKE